MDLRRLLVPVGAGAAALVLSACTANPSGPAGSTAGSTPAITAPGAAPSTAPTSTPPTPSTTASTSPPASSAPAPRSRSTLEKALIELADLPPGWAMEPLAGGGDALVTAGSKNARCADFVNVYNSPAPPGAIASVHASFSGGQGGPLSMSPSTP